MSNYHPIYHKMWEDHKFQEYTPEQKLVFIYIITNVNCKISGIYEISPRTISSATNIDLEQVKDILASFNDALSYDFTNGIVYAKNFFKYNLGKMGNARVIQQSLLNNLRINPHIDFWKDFDERYKEELIKIRDKVAGFKKTKTTMSEKISKIG